MTYPPQAPVYGSPPPKKKSRVGLIIGISVGAVVLLCIGISAIVALAGKGGTPTTNSNPGAAAPGNDGPVAVGLNQSVRDGKFEFTATKVECGITQIGNQYLNQKAQGQYCKVTLNVKNIGGEARMFDASSQKAYNAAGAKYDADATAGIYLEDNGNAFLENINPGNAVAGTLLFDIPKDASIAKVELHDSAFSGGVTVNLT